MPDDGEIFCVICGIGSYKRRFQTKRIPKCFKCYNKTYVQAKNLCSSCGKTALIVKKIDDGGLCDACYRRPMKTCCLCGKFGRIKKISEAGPVCSKCYKTPEEVCINCGNFVSVYKRERGGSICKKCYKKEYEQPYKACHICGQFSKTVKISPNGPICRRCYAKTYDQPIRECSICSRFLKASKKNPGEGHICHNCYMKEKIRTDIGYRISCSIRRLLRKALKRGSSSGKNMRSMKYGVDFEKIIQHLSPCPDDIDRYHVDHIFPLSAFDMNNPVHIRAAFAPENHQWLTALENLAKWSHYNRERFREYIRRFEKEYDNVFTG